MKIFFSALALILILFPNFSCRKNTNGPTSLMTRKSLVVLGSSTAFGTGATSIDSSWVGLLRSKFEIDNKGIKIVNLALGGFTTYDILPTSTALTSQSSVADTERNVTKALSYNPNFIIINLPSNDIANNYLNEEIINNYKRITAEIVLKKVPYLITGTQPRNFPDIAQRTRLKFFNAELENIYHEKVDNYYDVLTDSVYKIKSIFSFGDGIHLNNKGHKLIFEELSSNQLLQQSLGYK